MAWNEQVPLVKLNFLFVFKGRTEDALSLHHSFDCATNLKNVKHHSWSLIYFRLKVKLKASWQYMDDIAYSIKVWR
jgi:hypothetical protein